MMETQNYWEDNSAHSMQVKYESIGGSLALIVAKRGRRAKRTGRLLTGWLTHVYEPRLVGATVCESDSTHGRRAEQGGGGQ
ncbi:hypothetical protein K0M31_003366 [Melipona bicolor]|uniref:Uncharacterized protein n=1 Tax=Melipona bicolor TaxID=60889 RepID=A0AA40FZ30_9HYME|nr:hypothetical protein K0M31_003366 [Melipona bicolor]